MTLPVTAEAPGRIDFLGGVADYSGSLVLQMPIRATTRVTIAAAPERTLTLTSRQEGAFTASLPRWRRTVCSKCDLATVRAFFDAENVPGWARYALGCFTLHARRFRWWPETGLGIAIDSRVPTSMGVSSSAAMEVATLRALVAFSGHAYAGTELARTAQRAENEIVGAPCGLMDQLASAHGVPGQLLPILCRPDGLGAPVRLPAGCLAVGWPSGVKHAVGASPYATARASAFIGRRMVEAALGRPVAHATEFAPSEVRLLDETELPAAITGREFLRRHGGVEDPLTRVDPKASYFPRAGVRFPIEENFRAATARALLERPAAGTAELLGELMYQSHAGYSSIGLDCPETDAMVAAVRALGPGQGFFGARVSGGGSGGTVVVLLRREALPRLRALARELVFAGEPLPLIV